MPNIVDIIQGTPPAPGTEAKMIAKIKAIVRARAVVKVLSACRLDALHEHGPRTG